MWNLGGLVAIISVWLIIERGSAGMPPTRMLWWLRLNARVTSALFVVLWVLLLFA